jgi:hypothetical protein
VTKYTVVGDRAFQGHAPGSQFSANLADAEEKRAVGRGQIKRSGKTKTATKAKGKE